MIKYFIVFQGCQIPLKILGYKFLEKINLNENLIENYFLN